jgi:hypothetical protein
VDSNRNSGASAEDPRRAARIGRSLGHPPTQHTRPDTVCELPRGAEPDERGERGVVRPLHKRYSCVPPVAVEPVGGVINLPVRDLVATVIAVFRNSDGEVIDAQGRCSSIRLHPSVPSRPTSDVSTDERPVFVPGAKPASVPGTNVGSR